MKSLLLASALFFGIAACQDVPASSATPATTPIEAEVIAPLSFDPGALLETPVQIPCTLETGIEATCLEITVGYQPEGLEIGPFCPSNIDEKGGIWDWDGENAGLYRLDRAFFEMLTDQGYRFYDENGDIAISDPGSGQPPQAEHTCLMAAPDESVIITMRIPVDPVMADTPSPLGTVAKVGIALDGVPIFADAPSVLDTGHLPSLDVCGGHIDPGGWYHWHATSTDIDTILETEGVDAHCDLTQDPTAVFGYAFDGFPILGSLEADGSIPKGLDTCSGHIDDTVFGETYHYHASVEFPNLPPCLVGVVAQDNFSTTALAGIGAERSGGPGPAGGPPPGFEEAATQLGISSADLMDALGGPGQQPDFASVAQQLGVTEADLRAALPMPR